MHSSSSPRGAPRRRRRGTVARQSDSSTAIRRPARERSAGRGRPAARPTRSVVPKPRSASTSLTTCSAGLGVVLALGDDDVLAEGEHAVVVRRAPRDRRRRRPRRWPAAGRPSIRCGRRPGTARSRACAQPRTRRRSASGSAADGRGPRRARSRLASRSRSPPSGRYGSVPIVPIPASAGPGPRGPRRATSRPASRRASSRRRGSVAPVRSASSAERLVGVVAHQASSNAASSSSPTSGDTCSKRWWRASSRRDVVRRPASADGLVGGRPLLDQRSAGAGRPRRGAGFSRAVTALGRGPNTSSHSSVTIVLGRAGDALAHPHPARTARRARRRGRRRVVDGGMPRSAASDAPRPRPRRSPRAPTSRCAARGGCGCGRTSSTTLASHARSAAAPRRPRAATIAASSAASW